MINDSINAIKIGPRLQEALTKATHYCERLVCSDDSSLLSYALTVTQPESGPEFQARREPEH